MTPHPAIVVNFRSYSTGCDEPTLCSVEIADTVLRQGQGMHGSFSRGDTMNFMAAIGPDFKAGFVSELPVSNADVGITAAHLLGLTRKPQGHAARPYHDGSNAEWPRLEIIRDDHCRQARSQWPADRAEVPARRATALLRCGRISGKNRRPSGDGQNGSKDGRAQSSACLLLVERARLTFQGRGNSAAYVQAAGSPRRSGSRPAPRVRGCCGGCRASGRRSTQALRY